MTTTTLSPRDSLKEELVTSVSHGVGALLSVGGLILLTTLANLRGNAWHVVGCSIFGASLVFLYTASTLYHSIRQPGAKRVLRVFDHCAIFLLIAGTYTPFTLVSLRGGWGWTLFAVVWGLALIGIIYKVAAKSRYRLLSVLLYLAMGWLVLIAVVYLVFPRDLIPDFLGSGLGLIDDLSLIALLTYFYRNRLREYLARETQESGGQGHRERSSRAQAEASESSFDPYETLGIDSSASSEEIQAAYKARMHEYHPDKVAHLGEELQKVAHRKAVEIQQAYEQLRK